MTPEELIEAVPVAWTIPGDDGGRESGWVDCMAWSEGEFTKPLYSHATVQSLISERDAALARVAELEGDRCGACNGKLDDHYAPDGGGCPGFRKQVPSETDAEERERLRLAGISTAALGYWKEGDAIHPDYDTPALRDVAKLYAKYDELFQAAATPAVKAPSMKLLGYANPFRIEKTCADRPGGAHLGQVAIYAGESVDPMDIQEQECPTFMGEPNVRDAGPTPYSGRTTRREG